MQAPTLPAQPPGMEEFLCGRTLELPDYRAEGRPCLLSNRFQVGQEAGVS